MELEWQPASIKQWYDRTIILDRNQRESRREEERLRRRRDNRVLAPRLNNMEAFQQQLLQSQIQPRRQEVPQQQILAKHAPMEEVERTNVVIVRPTQRAGLAQQNPYAMDIDRERNCYSYEGFDLIAWNCRRQIMGQERRMEYEINRNNKDNLNEEGDLIVLNQISTITDLQYLVEQWIIHSVAI